MILYGGTPSSWNKECSLQLISFKMKVNQFKLIQSFLYYEKNTKQSALDVHLLWGLNIDWKSSFSLIGLMYLIYAHP